MLRLNTVARGIIPEANVLRRRSCELSSAIVPVPKLLVILIQKPPLEESYSVRASGERGIKRAGHKPEPERGRGRVAVANCDGLSEFDVRMGDSVESGGKLRSDDLS